MVRLGVLTVAAVGAAWVGAPFLSADDNKKGPADPTAELLSKLRQPLALPGKGAMPLAAFAAEVEKALGIGVVVNEEAFGGGAGAAEDDDGTPVRPVRFKGASAATVLRSTLAKKNATYLVRRDHIEIVPAEYARRQARQSEPQNPETGEAFAAFPLVSAVVKERPLNEALAEIAADYDLTVVVAPQAGDARTTFVTARLLNVPADRAIDLLATQADLRVERRGAAFLVTSKEHREGMFNERMDREQRKIEVENMRNPGAFLGQPGLGICGAIGNLGALGFAGGGPAPKGGFGGGQLGGGGAGIMGGPAPRP